LRLVARLRAPNAPTRELLAAAEELTRREPTIGTILDLLAAGRAEELAATLTGDADEAQAMARLCESLFRVLAHALVSAGCGHWRLCWARPSELVVDELSLSGVRSTDSGQLAETVFSAVEGPTEVDRLRFHLITLGFNPDAQLTVEPAEPRRLLVRPRQVDQLGRDRRNVVTSGVIGLAVAAVVLLFGFGQRASTTPPPTPAQYTVAPSNVARPLPGSPPVLGPPRTPSGTARPPDLTSTVIVRAGQTLPAIAACYGTTVTHLQQDNDLGDSTQLHIGEKLSVPFLLAPPRC
jgi:hypothetical protein